MPRLRKTISAFATLAALAAAAGFTPALGQSAQPAEDLRRLRGGIEPDQSGNPEAAAQARNGEGQRTADGLFATDLSDPLLDPLSGPPDPLRDPLSAEELEAARTAPRVIIGENGEDDPYAALGVRMGSFLLFPELSLNSVYNDNLFLSTGNPRADWALALNPSLRIRSGWSRHSLTATLSGERSYHARFPGEDDKSYAAGLTGQLDIRRDTNLAAAVNYSQSLDDRSSSDFPDGSSARTITRNQNASLEGNHSFNRVTLTLRGELFDEDFDDGTTIGGAPINNDDRDVLERRLTGRVSYEFQPGVAAFFEASVNERDFAEAFDDDGTRNGSSGYDVQGGVSFELTGKLTGEFSAGYALQSPDETTLGDVSGLIFNAGLEWLATGLTTVRFDAASEVTETTVTGSAGSIVRSADVSVEHRPRRHIIVGASLGYEREEFSGNGIVDEEIRLGLAGEYNFTRSVALTAAFSHLESTSNTPDSDYSVNQVRLGVRLRR